MLSRQWTGSSAHTFTYDSANRLMCIGSGAPNCAFMSADYDVDGGRIRQTLQGEGETLYFGDLFEFKPSSSGDSAKLFIAAFGRQYAYKGVFTNVVLRADSKPFGLSQYVDRDTVLRIAVSLSACGLVLIVVVGTRRRTRLRRPLYAGLSVFLAITIAVPPTAWSGGGYPIGYPMYRRWMFGDQVGTMNVIVTENGTQAARFVFGAFGQSAGTTGLGEDAPEIFAGHREVHYLNVAYMGARWYDMISGRFMSIDSQVSDIADPQTLNPYGYVENNPVNQSDPTGSVSISIFVNGSRGAVVISGGAGNIGGIGGLPGGVLGCGFAGCTGRPFGNSATLPPIVGIGGGVLGSGALSSGFLSTNPRVIEPTDRQQEALKDIFPGDDVSNVVVIWDPDHMQEPPRLPSGARRPWLVWSSVDGRTITTNSPNFFGGKDPSHPVAEYYHALKQVTADPEDTEEVESLRRSGQDVWSQSSREKQAHHFGNAMGAYYRDIRGAGNLPVMK